MIFESHYIHLKEAYITRDWQSTLGMAMSHILPMRIDVHIRIYPYTFAHIRALSASFCICRMAIPSQLVVVGSAVDSTFLPASQHWLVSQKPFNLPPKTVAPRSVYWLLSPTDTSCRNWKGCSAAC